MRLSYGSVWEGQDLSRRIVCVAVLLLCLAVAASPAEAQAGPSTSPSVGFELGQNYPNPFNPETTVPFTLSEELLANGPAVVTIRIFNILSQLVAYPVALGHPAGAVEVRGLEYSQPGRHEAFWDGTDQSGRQVASGIYLLQLTVNGESRSSRMIVQK